jgi:AcrR family transcriptional regulator
VVTAAIAMADDEGLEAVTTRALAGRLAVSPMTLYTYVPGKAELVDLMVDAIYAEMPRPVWNRRQSWRTRLRAIADANRALFAAHPWVARVSTSRPPLGPGLLGKYEHELGALEGFGLDDVEMDAALTFLLDLVRTAAVSAEDAAAAPGSDAAWWAEAGPLLARVVDPERYPLASRVGTASGAAQGGAYDPAHAYAFALERALDGLGTLIAKRGPRQYPNRRSRQLG